MSNEHDTEIVVEIEARDGTIRLVQARSSWSDLTLRRVLREALEKAGWVEKGSLEKDIEDSLRRLGVKL